MTIRTARLNDNDKLVELARLTPMQGTISICIQRQPDFFSLLHKKGEPHVLVAEEDDMIVGCVSIVKVEMVLLNRPTTFHYLCDLKVHPQYRNKKVATQLCQAMHEYLIEIGGDLLFSTFADGNQKVIPIMNGKSGIKNAQTVGKFHILQLVPQKNAKLNTEYEIVPYSDEEKVLQLHQKFSKRYVLHPSISAKSFLNCTHYAALKNNEPVAVISLFDPRNLKQNILIDLPWYFDVAVKLLRVAKPVLSLPYLPHKGESISILYVKAFSYLPGYEDAFLSLLNYAKQIAFTNNYSFLSITFHETDELRKRLQAFKAFPFKAHGMICSLKNNSKVIDQIKGGNVLEDFSLI